MKINEFNSGAAKLTLNQAAGLLKDLDTYIHLAKFEMWSDGSASIMAIYRGLRHKVEIKKPGGGTRLVSIPQEVEVMDIHIVDQGPEGSMQLTLKQAKQLVSGISRAGISSLLQICQISHNSACIMSTSGDKIVNDFWITK